MFGPPSRSGLRLRYVTSRILQWSFLVLQSHCIRFSPRLSQQSRDLQGARYRIGPPSRSGLRLRYVPRRVLQWSFLVLQSSFAGALQPETTHGSTQGEQPNHNRAATVRERSRCSALPYGRGSVCVTSRVAFCNGHSLFCNRTAFSPR